MKGTIQLHPLSVAVGAGLSVLAVLLLGMAPQVQPVFLEDPFLPIRVSGTVNVPGIPQAKDIVNLSEGTPYTVPEGKILIITDYAVSEVDGLVSHAAKLWLKPTIMVDGAVRWATGYYAMTNDTRSYAMTAGGASLSSVFRSGVRADAGQLVVLSANPSASLGTGASWETTPRLYASGYLAHVP